MNMNSFLAIVILSVSLTLSNAFAVNTENEHQIDYRLNLNLDGSSTFAEGDKPCSKSGLMCKNCNELVNCVPMGNGSWREMPVTDCSKNDMVCGETMCKPDGEVPGCSTDGPLAFLCWMIGIFPDPSDCKKYHMCYAGDSEITAAEIICENSDQYYYNPKTHYCDKKLPTNGECSGYPVPVCKKAGDTNSLAENPTIYYTCANYPGKDKVLYPFQMVCENGKTYSTAISGCR